MIVKTFHPVIATSHADDTIAFFESIGFKIAHRIKGANGEVNNTQLKDDAGHIVEVTRVGSYFDDKKDTMMIHINIDDYDEDCKFMESKGFKAIKADEAPFAKYCTFEAPTGFKIDLCKHIKKDK